jgi:hypothetical protein
MRMDGREALPAAGVADNALCARESPQIHTNGAPHVQPINTGFLAFRPWQRAHQSGHSAPMEMNLLIHVWHKHQAPPRAGSPQSGALSARLLFSAFGGGVHRFEGANCGLLEFGHFCIPFSFSRRQSAHHQPIGGHRLGTGCGIQTCSAGCRACCIAGCQPARRSTVQSRSWFIDTPVRRRPPLPASSRRYSPDWDRDNLRYTRDASHTRFWRVESWSRLRKTSKLQEVANCGLKHRAGRTFF